MPDIIVKDSGIQGKGVFANRDFKKGELLFNIDLSRTKKTIKEKAISSLPNKEREHLTFIGNGKFFLDYSATSFINHSCDSNLYLKYSSYAKYQIVAKKPIKKNEELTLDYALDKGWKQGDFLCNCKSKNCRKIIQSQ